MTTRALSYPTLLALAFALALAGCGARTGLERSNDGSVPGPTADAHHADAPIGVDHGLWPPDACVPACGARRCGPDPVCGLTCGTCPVGLPCLPTGVCSGGGPTWQPVPHPPINSLHSVWANGPSDVWMVGDANTSTPNVLRGIVLHYDGTSVVEVPSPAGPVLYGIWGTGPKDIWVVGADGRILYRSTASSFGAFPSPTKQILFDVWAPNAGSAYAVGHGGVFRYASGGGWKHEAGPWKLTSVSGRSTTDVWAAGPAGLFRYDGKSWKPHPVLPPDFQAAAVWCGPGDDVWVAINNNTALRIQGSWGHGTKLPGKQDLGYMWDVHGTSNSDVWMVGSDAIYHSDGAKWSIAHSSGAGFGIFAYAPDDVWVVGIKLLLRYH